MEFISSESTFLTVALILIGVWIYCLVDVLKGRFNNNDKLIWLITVILIPLIGSILYLVIGKRKKIQLN